jgi:putative transposase
VSDEDIQVMRLIDVAHFMGSEQLSRDGGESCNRKRIQSLCVLWGYGEWHLDPISVSHTQKIRFTLNLLRGMAIDKVNQVCSTDTTYIPMA